MGCDENCGITLGESGVVHTGSCISLKDTILNLRRSLAAKDEELAQSRLVIDKLKVEVYDATHTDDDPWS